MHRLAIVVIAAAALACSGRTATDGGDASEGDSQADSETGTGTTTSIEPDLPSDPPEWCENGANVLDPCSTNTIGFSCDDTPSPDTAVPMCDDWVSGPGLLGLTHGLAACGCAATENLRLRDLDGDGADELLAGCTSPHAVLVWRGRADGVPSCAEVLPVESPRVLWVVDVDGDGLEDLVTVSTWPMPSMSLLRTTQPGVFEAAQALDGGIETTLLTTLEFDIDGDGRPELLGTSLLDDGVDFGPVITWAAEAGQVSVSLDVFGDLKAASLASADIDGDEWPDLVVGGEQSWWARGSEAGLGMPQPFDGGTEHFSVVLGDIDGDQLSDFVDNSLWPPSYRLGTGDGNFGDTIELEWNTAGYVILARDLDGDGRVELIRQADGDWTLWRSDPSGPILDSHVHGPAHFFESGDVDGDGLRDLVTATVLQNSTNSQITRWRASP